MDKVLLITGASSEVGIELLKAIHNNYNKIYLQYRNMNPFLEETIKMISRVIDVIPIKCDLSNEMELQAFINSIKNSGILPNNIVHLPAPKAYNIQFHKDKIENFDFAWDVCVKSAVNIIQAFVPSMSKQRYGRVVFMLTSNTLNKPAKYQSSYVTTKYALLGLMKALSVEYAAKGITFNGVSPDMMETKFIRELPELIVEMNAANSPLKRNIRVSEVVPVISYFLSDIADAVTGENFAITGGL